jgi:hypothetical protein
VDLAPEGIHFDVPVTLFLHLSGTTGAGDGNDCSIVWFNTELDAWEILPTTVVGPDLISAELHHFSKYGGLLQ